MWRVLSFATLLSLSPITLLSLLSGSLVLLHQLYLQYRRLQKISAVIDQIPGPRVSSYLMGHLSFIWYHGNNTDWFQQIFNTFVGVAKIYQENSQGFIRFWIGPTHPMVVIFDAECAEGILTSNVNVDKAKEFDFAIPWLGLGLFTRTGAMWRTHRKLLTPTFHFRILESFVPIINKQQQVMLTMIQDQMDSNMVIDDLKPLVTNCALDIICETAMGVNVYAQTDPESKFSRSVRRVLDLLMMRFLSPWLWNEWVFGLSPTGFEQRRTIKYLHQFTKSVIKRKKKEIEDGMVEVSALKELGTSRVLAFLDSLFAENIRNPGSLSDEDIRAEVDTFMSAGQETNSSTVQFALQLIGHHPKIQARIHQELDSIYADDPNRDVRFEDLKEMKYLEKCIKETLRLFPPFLFIARRIKKEFEIKGKIIPKETTCLVLFYQLHRDPKYFPNPEVFDPERFSPENMNGRHPFAYTPFSAGPRNCIGQRFALQTTKALTAAILRRYRITSLVPMDKVELAIGITVGQKNKLTIRFENRIH